MAKYRHLVRYVALCGGMCWYVVVFGGMWWYVAVCAGMWWYVVKSVTRKVVRKTGFKP